MNKAEARQLLTEKLGEYRKLSFVQLVAKIDREDHFEILGASGTAYQIEVQCFWDDKPGGDLRVMATIDDGGLLSFVPLCQDFILSPEGRFVGE